MGTSLFHGMERRNIGSWHVCKTDRCKLLRSMCRSAMASIGFSRLPRYLCMGRGVLSDPLGRPSITRDPLQVELKVGAPNSQILVTDAKLLAGDEATYLVDANGSSVSVSQYLAGQGGVYSFTTNQY